MLLTVTKGSREPFVLGTDSSGFLHSLLQQRLRNNVHVSKGQTQPEFCTLIYVDFHNFLTKSFSVKVLQPEVISVVAAECSKDIQ